MNEPNLWKVILGLVFPMAPMPPPPPVVPNGPVVRDKVDPDLLMTQPVKPEDYRRSLQSKISEHEAALGTDPNKLQSYHNRMIREYRYQLDKLDNRTDRQIQYNPYVR